MLTLKEINIKLNNIERNIAKIIIILIFYVIAAKMNTQRDIDATTTTIIMLYNNINQQKELKKDKKEKTLIFIIKKQSEKNNLRMLFVKKLIKCLQRIEKIKENVMMTKRFFNENVKLIIRSKKVKNRLIINNSLMKNVASSTYAMSRIFEILIHEVRVIDVQTSNQQKIIRRIKKQNEILHSNLRIARII
jgi:transcription initiation factor TFIIIB Brf1 subunit/transcription initiation factor TFIIB